jgi:predicted dehydrogenase
MGSVEDEMDNQERTGAEHGAIGLGVIGVGLLGERHARAWSEIRGAHLVGVADLAAERAEAVGARFGVPAFVDPTALLDRPEVDAVSIATPDHLHAAPVLAALERGKHVLVEKPLATSLDEAEALVAAARDAKRILMVNYSQRFVPEFHWAKRQIEAGTIGRPLIIRSLKDDRISVPTEMLRWAAESSPIFFMTSHDLDLVRWYLDDEVETVYAQKVSGVLRARGIDVHDGVEVLARFRGGAIATFHSSWIHPGGFPGLTDSWLQIIGSDGVLSLGRGREHEVFTSGGANAPRFGTADDIGGTLRGAFRSSLEYLLEAIRTGVEPMTSAARTLGVTATQCAIIESLRQRGEVRVKGYTNLAAQLAH